MMTSIHMNPGESQTTTSTNLNGSLNQSLSSPNKYDEAERVRQRMEQLRRHHAETVEIHHRTQPMIDDQIHEDTLKYLKTGSVNGTKARSQKPRAPKRQRGTASNNTSQTAMPVVAQAPAQQAPTFSPNMQQSIQIQPQQPNQMHQPQSYNYNYQNRYQAQPVYQQQHQHQQPHQSPHLQHQQQHRQQQQQPLQQQQQQHHQLQHQQHQQLQQPQQSLQPLPHGNPSHAQVVDQSHHHYVNMHSNTYAQQNHQSYYQSQQMINNHHIANHYTTLPTDLDLNIQAGLECDVDFVINYEIDVEGQLDFNPDLLVKLDNHYQPNYQ